MMTWMRTATLSIAIGLVAAGIAHAQATTDSTSAQSIDAGKSVYGGRAGGALCFTCHGPAGKGIPGLGPDLTDAGWLHGDGGFEFLQQIVRTGVQKPKQSMTIMPPMGGGKLSPEQLAALAAYLKSLR
jgi:mono/diheme cytochrome c family protein